MAKTETDRDIINTNLLRKETTGYVDDYMDPDMLFAVVLRAPTENGRVLSFDFPQPHPTSLVTFLPEEIAGVNTLSLFEEKMPVLSKRFYYQGEPVMLLAGKNEGELIYFKDHITVSYESLSSLPEEEPTHHRKREITVGNPAKSMKNAHKIIEGSYYIGSQDNPYNDPMGAFVCFDDNRKKDKLLIYCPTQFPYHVRKTVAEVLGWEEEQVSVRVTDIRSGQDSKLWYPSLVAAHASLLAVKSGKPIRLIPPPAENRIYTIKNRVVTIKHTTGVDKKGAPMALKIEAEVDAGAYPVLSGEVLDRVCIGAPGVYTCKDVSVTGTVFRSNTAPLSAFSGLGLSQAFFAAEIQYARLAEIAEIDPYSWKMDNLRGRNNMFITGGSLPQVPPLKHTAERVVKDSDFSRKYAAYQIRKKRGIETPLEFPIRRGIGLALGYQGGGFLGKGEKKESYSVIARLEKEEQLYIFTSGVTGNPSLINLWKRRAADILDVDEKNVVLEFPDTDFIPDSGPSILSRNITVITRLIETCCSTIQKKRFRSPLPIEVKQTYRIPSTVQWDQESFQGTPFPALSWGSVVVELEIDTVTLETMVRGIWCCVDCGRIIDESLAQKSVESGILQTLDWITAERSIFSLSSGTNQPFSFSRSYSVPDIHIEFLTSNKKARPGGVGELPASLLPPAYVTALSQATGSYFDTIPVHPELIRLYMEEP